jgi:serine/threonine protein kinase
VFDLKAVVNVKDAKSGPALRTLRELLDETGAPSVNLRISFAITLLETLLQLHTSGWLHKEFRSDNVIFLRDTFDYVDDFLSAPMRVTGYAYARADQPQEPTEPLQSEVELDLYRHPRCLGHTREFFRRAFDIFSVGCILLEIGFWCSLSNLFRRESGHSQGSELQTLDLLRIRREMLFSPVSEKAHGVKRKPVNGSIKGERSDIFCKLQASMGKGYSEVVKALIHTPDLEDKAHASTTTKSEAYHGWNLLDLEMDCLERLRSIAAVL